MDACCTSSKNVAGSISKYHKRTNWTELVVPHDSLLSVGERFDVTSTAVFDKYLNSHPFQRLSRIVPSKCPTNKKDTSARSSVQLS